MKKLALVLSTSILLVACNNNSSEKGVSKIESESNQSNKDRKESSSKQIQKSKKVKTDDFDISSKEFIDEFTKDNTKGFRGIVPGITYEKAKEKLGNPTSYSIDEMPNFGGFRVCFNNFILVFDESVKIKSDLKDDSKVKYVFLQNKNAPRQQEFEKEWGTTDDVTELGAAGSIVSLSYDINNTKVDAFYSHGIIEYVTKEDLKSIGENVSNTSNKDDNNITEVNGVSHYNTPDILSNSFAESIKRNTFEIAGFGLLKETDKDPYTALKIDYEESRDGTAVYDNFSFELKNGTGPKVDDNNYPVHSITLNVEDQGVKIDDLVEQWDISDNHAFIGGTFDIYNFDSTYVTFNYEENSRVIYEIIITGGNFSEGAAPGDLESDNTQESIETEPSDTDDNEDVSETPDVDEQRLKGGGAGY
ncbi:hypothetical protein [Macrococcus capreoli]|uniref:hypothetical protein n=1 Tax=Macrococcus capreoli TaxID=2982690 RepID=UPI003F42F23B